VLLADPLARLLFQHGQFTADDALRASRVVACYASGVWAFCASPVIVRGYYALGDRTTPVKIGMAVVALNFCLNLCLVWPLAECGLAVATTVAAIVQTVVLTAVFARRQTPLAWPALGATALRAALASAAMLAVGAAAMMAVPAGSALSARLLRVLLPLVAALASYFAVYRLLGGRELGMLFSGVVPEHERLAP
jgi:putative peptidoglycan lipid II flippase